MDSAEVAKRIRIDSLTTAHHANLGHPGGDLSCADILATLFSGIVNPPGMAPNEVDRHRFVMSKGHAALAYYSALVSANLLPGNELHDFAKAHSRLSGHPASAKISAIETSTGPLGHGLPIGVGMALAARFQKSNRKTFVLCGDGELQEGSNWEAAMLAGHHRLSNIVCIVDRNFLQQGKLTEEVVSLASLAKMFFAFGWHVLEIDGNDTAKITPLLMDFVRGRFDKPLCVIARTKKGRGVSFMEGKPEWHHRIPTKAELKTAIDEISSK
jgi:transketolase